MRLNTKYLRQKEGGGKTKYNTKYNKGSPLTLFDAWVCTDAFNCPKQMMTEHYAEYSSIDLKNASWAEIWTTIESAKIPEWHSDKTHQIKQQK